MSLEGLLQDTIEYPLYLLKRPLFAVPKDSLLPPHAEKDPLVVILLEEAHGRAPAMPAERERGHTYFPVLPYRGKT